MPQGGRWSVDSRCNTGETRLIFMIFACACVQRVCKCVHLPVWAQVHSPEDNTGCPALPFCHVSLRQDLSLKRDCVCPSSAGVMGTDGQVPPLNGPWRCEVGS